MDLDDSIETDVMLMRFENGQYTAFVRYEGVPPSNDLRIFASKDQYKIVNATTKDEIMPTFEAGFTELLQMNEFRLEEVLDK